MTLVEDQEAREAIIISSIKIQILKKLDICSSAECLSVIILEHL